MRIVQIIHLGCLAVFALAACQAAPYRVSPEISSQFADNTETYKHSNKYQRSALNALSAFKRGHETFDISLLKSALSENYERLFLASSNKVIIDDRKRYIAARSSWIKSDKPRRELRYSINEVTTDDDGKGVTVVALSTYKSKYFNPRFLETLRFEDTDGSWLLSRQTMLPLSPVSSEQLGVQIYLMSWDIDLSSGFSKLSVSAGADHVIERILEKTERDDDTSGSGILKQLLIVFREPPPVGTEIAVEHQWPDNKTSLPVYRFEYEVKEVKPLFVLENLVTLGCCPDANVSFTVYVNGSIVAWKNVAGG